MSDEGTHDERSDFERRMDNRLEAIVENQAKFDGQMAKVLEAIADLIQVERIQNVRTEENSKQIVALIEVARTHDEQIDELRASLKEQRENIDALAQQAKEQNDRINALIRIVEGHISNHP